MKIHKRLFMSLISGIATAAISHNAFAYDPPIGIPAPDFGIDEIAPAQPAQWPSAEAPGYYYVDNTHANATDTGNTYGYPDKPRLTPPFGNAPLPAGTYIEVNGLSGQTYAGGLFRFDCSQAAPCWFVGSSGGTQPVFTSAIELQQGQYAIIENITVDGATDSGIRLTHPGSDFNTHHISVRNNAIKNNINSGSSSSAVSLYPGSNSSISDIVFYNNTISNAGTPGSGNFMSGIKISGRDGSVAPDERIWVLENTITNPAGTGVQITGIDRAYIGKNSISQAYTNGIQLQDASNSIVSQNTVSGGRQAGSGEGWGFYTVYPGDNYWVMFNTFFDNAGGIYESGSTNVDSRGYYVGNWIYDSVYNGTTELNGLGLNFVGGSIRTIVDNVIDNTRGGMNFGNGSSTTLNYVAHNLMTNIYGLHHIYGGNLSKRDGALNIEKNFFGEAATVWFNNGDYATLSDFTTARADQCTGCQENVDPLYVDRTNADSSLKDFSLQAGSPAIGQSAEYSVYQTFYDFFGRDIRVDFQDEPRPTTGAWDLGADQYFDTTAAPTVLNTTLSNASQYQPYYVLLSNADGLAPFNWSLISGSLPAGMSLSASGELTGTPSASGTANFTVQVTDNNTSSGTQALSLVVDPAPPLAISTSSLPSVLVNSPYTTTLTPYGGKPAYTWALTSGVLPNGITLDTNTGTLSGTPTEYGVFNLTFELTDSEPTTVSANLSLEVFAEVTIDTTSLVDGIRDQAYSQNLTTLTGTAPFTWSATGLPAGLSLSTDGVLSGTPTIAGTSTVTLSVTDANASADSVNVDMTIQVPPVSIQTTSLATGDKYQVYSANLVAVDGSGIYNWRLITGSLPAGITMGTDGLISGTPGEFGDFTFTAQVTDTNLDTATQDYTLTVQPAPLNLATTSLNNALINSPYSATLVAEEGVAPYSWAITIGSLPAGLSLSTNGVISGTPADLVATVFTIEVTDALGATAGKMLGLYIDPPALAIDTVSLNGVEEGGVYSQNLIASGGVGPYQWRQSTGVLPSGLSMNSDGLISGTATLPGTFSFTAEVTDARGQTMTKEFSVTVSALPITDGPNATDPLIADVNILTSSLVAADVDTDYEVSLLAEGGIGEYQWSLVNGVLPEGLTLANGIISGQPQQSGNFTLTLEVSDSQGNTESRTYTLSINNKPAQAQRPGSSGGGGSIGSGVLVLMLLLTALRRLNQKDTLMKKMVLSVCLVSPLILTGCFSSSNGGSSNQQQRHQDMTAPLILSSSPAGTFSTSGTETVLQLSTDESASCKYDTTADSGYDEMTNTFVTSDGETHTATLTGLTNGQSYTFYVLCEDERGNITEKEYQIVFDFNDVTNGNDLIGGGDGGSPAPTDSLPPVRSQALPSGELNAGTNNVSLLISTDETASCRYSNAPGTAYAAMTNALTTNGNQHSATISGLNDGNAYTYYVRCEDANGNANDTDYLIGFSIAGGSDVNAPILSDGAPSGTLTWSTTSTNLQLMTNEIATCKLDTQAGKDYASMSTVFQLSGGNLHAHPVNGLQEGGSYTYYARCKDANDNVSTSDYVISFDVEDIHAPVPSAGVPSGAQPAGTTSIDISLNTDESAGCKYDTVANTPYAQMSGSFTTTGNTSHTTTISGLSDGNNYQYYVRCEDNFGNATDTDYAITFGIANPLDLTAPVISNGAPNQPLPTDTISTTLSVDTDEAATCKYDIYAGRDYANMSYSFDNTGGTSHSTAVTALTNGYSYTYYVRCEDISSNASAADYTIDFSVLGAVASGTPWSYVGIPYTDWAYNPFTIQPTTPSEWPAAPAQNYYYVEPDHPQATDTVQGGELTGTYGRFGYPDRPRATIPNSGWIGDVFEAGTVVWLKGGTYNGNADFGPTNFYGDWRAQFQGTAGNPVWFYGDPNNKPTFTGVQLTIYNSGYAIFDNLQWIDGNTSNNAISLSTNRVGDTHHITLRNLRFENMDYWGGGGAIIGIGANSDAAIHDIVAYKNIFKNNGGGYDWTSVDNDHHGYKVNGILGGNPVYRVWIIENQALAGDAPDPVDGVYKSLSGNLVQVGDQVASSGNNHHVFVAGNYQEYARQALGWTKKSSDVIFSSNDCNETFNGAGGNGQCYGHQYGLGDYNWWINNIARNSSSGWMHTANDAMTGPLFIVGNIFHNNTDSDRNDNWRTCSGASLYTQKGVHYFVNNVFDSQCYGIWAQTNRHSVADELHIYNNIFTNFSAIIDTSSRAIRLEDTNGMQIFMENNLFGTYNADVNLNGSDFTSITDLNNQSWASGNIVGDPLYADQANADYSIGVGSPAIDAGTQTYGSGAADVYQQFIDRYTGDPDYPGDPVDYWPKDFLKQNRVVNGAIDIGPYEMQ